MKTTHHTNHNRALSSMRFLPLAAAFVLCTSACTNTAFAWGQVGHQAVAAIAEANLNPKAKATIEKYIDGNSIIHYASWLDWYVSLPECKNIGHTASVDRDFKYTPAAADAPKIDAITAINQSINTLRDYKKLPPETVALHIKILVHLLGDVHCPVHVKYATIKTRFKVTVLGEEISYHQVWDHEVVDHRQTRRWSFSEWVFHKNRLTKEQIAEVTAGELRDWFNQTAQDSRVIYDWAKPGSKSEKITLNRDFLNKAIPLAESQIQKAGYRLAKVLNTIFSE